MKKIVAMVAMTAVVSALSVSVPVSAAPTGQYTRAGYIEDVDRSGNFTVLVDQTGNVWFWESATFQTKHGRKFLKPGSRVVICLDGRGTPEVTDDRIVDFEIYS